MFHRECLQMHLKISIDDNKIPIICPIIDCKQEININSVSDLLDKEYMARYDLFSFKLAVHKNAQRFLHCPTPDCEYVFCVEKKDKKEYFECPSCSIEYCLNCESVWHEQMSCDQYQSTYGKGTYDFEDQAAINHALSNNMKRCPTCQFWVYRIEGCNFMICRCGCNFCYDCGKRCEGDEEDDNVKFHELCQCE